jgi:hypothetical protein
MDTTTTPIEEAYAAYRAAADRAAGSWGSGYHPEYQAAVDERDRLVREFKKRYGQTVTEYGRAKTADRDASIAALSETKADRWSTEDLDRLAQEIVAGGHAANLIRLIEHHRKVQTVAKRCGNWECDNRMPSARMAYCSPACRQKAYRDRLRP